MLIAAVSILVAYRLRYEPDMLFSLRLAQRTQAFQPYFQLIVLAPFVRLFSYHVFGIYRLRPGMSRVGGDVLALFEAVCCGTVLFIIIVFLYRGLLPANEFSYSRYIFGFDWLLNLFFVTGIHSLVGILQDELRRQGIGCRRVAIQGIGRTGLRLAEEIELAPETGYRVAGFVASDYEEDRIKAGDRTYDHLGGTEEILDIVNRENLDEIVVTNVGSLGCDLIDFVNSCQKVDVAVKLVPDLFGVLFHTQAIEEMGGAPIIHAKRIEIVGVARVLKRLEDIALSLLGLILTCPLLLLTAVLIRLDSPGPIIFSQQRLGKNGRHFSMYKFRSMYRDAEHERKELRDLNEADGLLFKIKNDPRITRFGRVIRKASIDELPQLLNVLKGEMSLVGPRPLPVSDISRLEQWEQNRFSVVPGVTGLWQVNRIQHTSDELLKWDLYYIENWALWLDFKILLKTIVIVLSMKGAY